MFKKINRGLILTVLVVAGVIVYLVAMNAIRAGDRSTLKEKLEEYLPIETALYVQSESWSAIPQKEFIAQKADLQADISEKLKPYFVENEDCYKPLAEAVYYRNLNTVTDSEMRIDALSGQITKISDISFSGNTASVTATVNYRFEGGKSVLGNMSKSDSASFQSKNTYVFQKTGGEWKLFYSPGVNFYTNMNVMTMAG